MSTQINDQFGVHNANQWQHWALAYARIQKAVHEYAQGMISLDQLIDASGYSYGVLFTQLGIPEERCANIMGALLVDSGDVGSSDGGDQPGAPVPAG